MNAPEAERRLIDGRFELLQQLGGGGMGLVWRARDTALEREVVLKEVRPPDPAVLAADPAAARELRERVLREARALARLQHPNVVVIHHIVDTPEHPHPWLVMELVSGGSLADRLGQGPLGVAEAARIGRGVLSALRAAHAVGIQHRDVKPGNVLLRPDGTPVLADFGIAAIQDATALTATGALIGSPEYIAPERLRGQEGNPSSDLWSLGMLLYVSMEGYHPLRRASTLATLAAVLDEPLPPPHRAGPLGPLLSAVLAKDPAVRPDAEQFDRMLAAAESGSPTPSPMTAQTTHLRPGPPPPMDAVPYPQDLTRPTTARTTPNRAPAIVAAVAMVAVASGSAVWMLRPDSTAKANTTASTTVGTTLPTGTGGAPGAVTLPSSTAQAPAAKVDLLTPDGVRKVVDALRPFTPSGKVWDLTVYPEYAIARVPVASEPKGYDRIEYRDGRAAKETVAGSGEITPDDKLFDLAQYDWNLLPGLLKKAQDTLDVAQPKSRYMIVEPDIFDQSPALLIYLTDDYGSGYLETDPKGNVIRTTPKGS
ncbi:serine/threonine-protein kinase [Streptomyces sp. SP17BM10]|uniref:serine/threonine-protein kinase n=1 Tax=Streptomyces sp. SP17BM10 TaxID=3002530 RepID=UPI002E75E327|nr:serine/threonine-protein kinase [Streptomyces sp. SP17BM10]MEE1788601.1 serine/threonine-protein kinase [Streptomyces sp. SP17BM10]